MIATDLKVAARNLLRHTRRNVFLGVAIAAVAALLVLFLGVLGGIHETMFRSATTVFTGHVNVGGFYKVTSGDVAPLVTDYPRVVADIRRLVPELDFVTVRGRGYAKVVSDAASMDLVLAGLEVRSERGFRDVVQVKEGRLEDLSAPGTILLFEQQANRLRVRVGDALTLSAPTGRGVSNTLDVRVVAVARSLGMLSSFNAFLPEASLRQLYQLNDTTTGAIHLYLRDPGRAPQVASRLLAGLREAGHPVMDYDPQTWWMKFATVAAEGWTGQKLDVTTWRDEVSFLEFMLQIVEGLTTLLIGVLLVIVVAGIVNTLWIAIRERTREIGTLRAIGMQRTKVLWLFVLEAALLGLLGGAAGALVGWAIAAAVNAARPPVGEGLQMLLLQDRLELAVHPGAILGYVLAITLLTALASLLPALRAARLRPVTAMHHVG